MNKRVGAILAACLCVASIAPGPSVQAEGNNWPFMKPLKYKLRSLGSAKNFWYSITLEGPREAGLLYQIGTQSRPGLVFFSGAEFRTEPDVDGDYSVFGWGDGASVEQPIVHAYGQADGVQTFSVGQQYNGSPGRRPDWADRRGGFGSPGTLDRFDEGGTEPIVRVSLLISLTANNGTHNTAVDFSTDSPKVRVIAESWGYEVHKLITDKDFDGGGNRVVGSVSATGGTGVGAVAAVKLRKVLRFKRSAFALFFPGSMNWGFSPVGIPSQHALWSVKSRSRPWESSLDGSRARGWSVQLDGQEIPAVGEEDRYYTTGENFIASNPPGTYEFTIEAFAAAGVAWVAGMRQFVVLMALDADSPACSSSKVQWREKDGRKVCGPGPWRMKKGLKF